MATSTRAQRRDAGPVSQDPAVTRPQMSGQVALDAELRATPSASALPGIYRVAVAAPVQTQLAASLSVGHGALGPVLGDDDSHSRTTGSVALSLSPRHWLGLALRFDSRYDQHSSPGRGNGNGDSGSDSSFVVDPRLTVRAVGRAVAGVDVGAELRLWVPPGLSTPSFDVAATTVDLHVLATYRPRPTFSLTVNGGFRFDNSADSVTSPDTLSRADRMSLGVSDFDAVMLGLGGVWHTGRVDVMAEWTWQLLVGTGAPSALASPMRFGLGAGWWLSPSIHVQFLAEASPSRRPAIDVGAALVPLDPRIQLLAVVTYRRSGYRQSAENRPLRSGGEAAKEPDEPAVLEPRQSVGQLRGVIQSFRGKPIAGTTIRIEPGGLELAVDQGTFEIDLEPGRYTVIVRAPGYREQRVRARVRPDAVRILNIDLRVDRKR
ncbi:MAG: carboxypeptidase-like regulatory domain-containing protein [Proteobacteria bacterium]|nr:carboxypeptidase-like regulatory domain-containing protein [Pseudomonadota bacterium]